MATSATGTPTAPPADPIKVGVWPFCAVNGTWGAWLLQDVTINTDALDASARIAVSSAAMSRSVVCTALRYVLTEGDAPFALGREVGRGRFPGRDAAPGHSLWSSLRGGHAKRV